MKRNERPGWVFMTKEILKRFTLEDLNLSDRELVDKYREPYFGVGEPFSPIMPFALRKNIEINLAHERV